MDREHLQQLMADIHDRLQTLTNYGGGYNLVLNEEERHALLTALEIAGEL